MPRIIIIDDDNEFGELTSRRLQNAGFEATFQSGPFGTLNALRKGEYDLAIIDVAMPGLGGPQLVALIQERKALSGLKLLLYSSMDSEPLQEIASKLRVHAFLSKSAPKNELLKQVKTLLGIVT